MSSQQEKFYRMIEHYSNPYENIAIDWLNINFNDPKDRLEITDNMR